ncbi:MAG: HEPN domain-containing protein [Candidatus Woesearchaeota archaeon]
MYWTYWAITISYYAILYATKAILLTKGYEIKTHHSALIALGHLCLPTQIEKEDLELLNEAQKIFEEEYIVYFQEAKTESNTARYCAIKKYSDRRTEEIYQNARKFILKIKTIIE